MNPVSISLIAFGCIFGGMLLGVYLRIALPEYHLNDESKDVVKLGTGMIGMMAALVLGLLIASTKSSFDAFRNPYGNHFGVRIWGQKKRILL